MKEWVDIDKLVIESLLLLALFSTRKTGDQPADRGLEPICAYSGLAYKRAELVEDVQGGSTYIAAIVS